MNEGLFIREFRVDFDFDGPYRVVDYEVCREDTLWPQVSLRRDLDEQGRVSAEYAVLTIRDKGRPASPNYVKAVVVVRKANDLTPIPDVCGELLAHLQPRGDHFAYYVCVARVESRDIGNTATETTSPAPAVERTSPAKTGSFPVCPCVEVGTSVHETGTAETGAGSTPLRWWESPDEPQSNAG